MTPQLLINYCVIHKKFQETVEGVISLLTKRIRLIQPI